MARKLRKRVKLMDDIRNGILSHQDLENRLQDAKPINMPSW